jgi:hypothetical protein
MAAESGSNRNDSEGPSGKDGIPSGTFSGDNGTVGRGEAEVEEEGGVDAAAARVVAANEMLQERAEWEERLTAEFEQRAVERFEDVEQARKAYRENMVEVGGRRAREVMIRPGDHFEGEGEKKAFAYPGQLRTRSVEEDTKLRELNEEIERVEREMEALEDIRREAAERTSERPPEETPEPEAGSVNEQIRRIEGELEEENVSDKVDRIANLVGKKGEADRLEREREMLEEAMELEGETLKARVENARTAAKEAKEEFIEALDRVYETPQKAAMNFESVARREGFDEAAATLAHAPEELGEMKEGEMVSWETQDFVVMEPGRRTAAETYVRAPESEVQKAAKWTLAEAKRTELDLQNAMHREGLSRAEVYRRAGSRTRQKADQAAQVIQRADREHSKIRRRLGYHPDDRYEGDLEAERDGADEDTIEKLKERGQSEEVPSVQAKSAAMTVEKRREALQEALKEIYMSPGKAETRIEARAFADGISTDSESFEETVKDAGRDLSRFGTTDMQFGSLQGRGTPGDSGYQRSKSRRFLDMTRYARIAGEIAEEVVEQGPDQETEEAMKKVRTAFKGGAAAGTIVAVGVAKGTGYTYQKIRNGMDKQSARMELQRRIQEYGEALETYKDQKREATGKDIEQRLNERGERMDRDKGESETRSRTAEQGGYEGSDKREASEPMRDRVETVKEEARSDAVDARQSRTTRGGRGSGVMNEVAEMRENSTGASQPNAEEQTETTGPSRTDGDGGKGQPSSEQGRGGRGGRR